jgi:UDP-N-acetylglucosamine 2-epimerase
MLGLSFRGLGSFGGRRAPKRTRRLKSASARGAQATSGRSSLARVGFLFGTRPEAIKLAPVINACLRSGVIEPVICVTAQHRELLDQVLDAFAIRPQEDLNLMREGQSLSGFASRALNSIGLWLDRQDLAAIIVHGDTTTTLMAAVAAYHRRIPIGHVEAGLRTGEKYEPFPEEGNRRLTDHLADFHFAPTDQAAENLVAEGIDPASILVTGNTVVDAVLHVHDRVVELGVAPPVDHPAGALMVLATMHRRESFGAPLIGICRALRTIVERDDRVHLVVPVHPNPHVRPVVYRELGAHPRIALIEPPAYPQFIALLAASHLVLTDSGGLQEEAPVLGKPVLVLRRLTERPEGVQAGVARLVGQDPAEILAQAERLLRDPDHYRSFVDARSPFGDGHAADRIAAFLAGAFAPADREALRADVHRRVAV